MKHVGPKSTKPGMSTRPWPGWRNAPMERNTRSMASAATSDSTAFRLEKFERKEKLKHFNKLAPEWEPARRCHPRGGAACWWGVGTACAVGSPAGRCQCGSLARVSLH